MRWFKLVILLGHLFLDKSRLTAGNAWSYNKNDKGKGPDYWPHIYQVCSGFEQSPVNIDTGFLVHDGTLAFFNFTEYARKQGVYQILSTINLLTAVITYSGNKILLRGGSLSHDFTLYQVHFHWDQKSLTGSEHAIDGKRYSMEMQIIHYRSDYRSLSEAIQQKFSVAIVSFLFQVVEDVNPALDKLLKYFPLITPQNNTAYVHEFSLYDLLPTTQKMNFYRYEGSLTYPPCSETVIWSVAEPVINISQSQLKQFDQLNRNTFKSTHNNRVLQPLNGRIVLTTKVIEVTRQSKRGTGTRATLCQKLLSSALVLAVSMSWVSL